MSIPVIECSNLSKKYKLYKSEAQRVLDLLGLHPNPKAIDYKEALKDINLCVNRGERVALIGRNGAGKSTLLKVISGRIRPTTGHYQVSESNNVHLDVETSFHSDLSALENIKAFLATQQLKKEEQQSKLNEIIEFSELQDFIHEEFKNYSSGMKARLLFSTILASKPELLILDEILGVGDAYFVEKSFSYIRKISKDSATTLLLVTHDIYSALKICERFVWIDEGRIVMDTRASEALAAYEDSIRAQDEHRKRLKALDDLKSEEAGLFLEIRPFKKSIFEGDLFLREIRLKFESKETLTLDFSDPANSKLLDHNSSTWGAVHPQGVLLACYGRTSHKGLIALPSRKGLNLQEIEIGVVSEKNQKIALLTSLDGFRTYEEIDVDKEYRHFRMDPVHKRPINHTIFSNESKIYGTGCVRMVSLHITDEQGARVSKLKTGRTYSFHFEFEIKNPKFSQSAVLVLSFYRNKVLCTSKAKSEKVFLNSTHPKGIISITLPNLPLSTGEYWVTPMLTRSDYYELYGQRFFTVNPDVYYSQAEALSFNVENKQYGEEAFLELALKEMPNE